MSPSLVTLLTGLVLLAFGGHFLWHGSRIGKRPRELFRALASRGLFLVQRSSRVVPL